MRWGVLVIFALFFFFLYLFHLHIIYSFLIDHVKCLRYLLPGPSIAFDDISLFIFAFCTTAVANVDIYQKQSLQLQFSLLNGLQPLHALNTSLRRTRTLSLKHLDDSFNEREATKFLIIITSILFYFTHIL